MDGNRMAAGEVREISDAEVFENRELTDAEVFGNVSRQTNDLKTRLAPLMSSAPVRFMHGVADPGLGAVQLISKASPLSKQLIDIDGLISNIDKDLEYYRKTDGQEGVDVARFAGNVLSPVTAGAAKLIPAAKTGITQLMKISAVGGAVGGALTPVTDESSQRDFLSTKTAQAGVGLVAGGILGPVAYKFSEKVMPLVSKAVNKVNRLLSRNAVKDASAQTDKIIDLALKETGQVREDLPSSFIENLRKEVNTALNQGRELDASALLRKRDFDELGLPSTTGQITRDPTQFAKERNLRGIANVGEPLMETFETQNKGITQTLSGLGQETANDPYQAGSKIIGSLESADKEMASAVDKLYQSARDSAGRYASVDPSVFSKAANDALDEQMLGRWLPKSVKGLLNDVSNGKIPLNVNTLVQIDSVMSEAQRTASRSGDKGAVKAIGVVRDALNSSPIDENAGQIAKSAFDTAREAAKQRFKLQDAIPALKAVSSGDATPDTFVRNYIVNGNTDEVVRLAGVLKRDQTAYKEARSQIGNELYRAAFGENLTGDKNFRPESFAKAIRMIGKQKLKAFYSPDEIEKIYRIGRVGSYINTPPTASAVNTSNTGAAAANLVQNIPGMPAKANVLSSVFKSVKNVRDVNKSVRAEIPEKVIQLSDRQRKVLLRAMAVSSPGLGIAGSEVVE